MRARGAARRAAAQHTVLGVDDLAAPVGGHAAHVVVHGGRDGDGLLGDVDAGEDGGRFGDAGQALGEHLGRQVVEVQVQVLAVGAAAAALADLHGHGARDDVARGEVLGRRRVPLHEALALGVAQDAALAAAALGDQAARAVNARGVELHELGVFQRQPRAQRHGDAVTRARVRRRRVEVRAAVAARRQHRVGRAEAVQAAVLHAHGDHAHAPPLVHQQVQRKVLDKVGRVKGQRAAVPARRGRRDARWSHSARARGRSRRQPQAAMRNAQRVQQRVARAVRRRRAAVCLPALAVLERLPAKGALRGTGEDRGERASRVTSGGSAQILSHRAPSRALTW